jgi:hypothetical protein
VGREEPHCGQVDRRFCEHVEDHGKPAGGSGNLDPVVGLVLGEPQGVPAIDEERYAEVAIMRSNPFEAADPLLKSRRLIRSHG